MNEKVRKSIWCTLQIDGTHNWEDIPNIEELNDVQFLKSNHRHVFGFKCFAEVNHNNRDIEFIHIKRNVEDFLYSKYYSEAQRSHVFGSRSCEMLAEELCEQFNFYRCEVSEDNENGGIVEMERL